MKIKRSTGPLQQCLEELVTKVVAAQSYTGRDQLRDLCKMMKLGNADREKVLDKATTKGFVFNKNKKLI